MTQRTKTFENELISSELMYLFNIGENFKSYNILGAHYASFGKVSGYLFSVWAPNAEEVSVVCDKNGWREDADKMIFYSDFGIWRRFIPNITAGEKYKFCIKTKMGETLYKSDPFAFYSELRPSNASVCCDLSYEWEDKAWMKMRENENIFKKPASIYELHFSSWKKKEDGSFYTYLEMADELIPYIKDMGYTHIELLPVAEYPYDGSWGYQVTGYFSANSRFGTPKELKVFIDRCHQAGIGVIMDWVPAHFPKDAHGLARFDGECLYEHPDTRLGEHKEWGTLVFNWSKTEIHSFLISNAMFWLSEYHFDGLRVDAVSSMLYLDYNRSDGDWVPNKYGGKENLYAIDFLKKLNTAVFSEFNGIMMIAEESTAWPNVTKPTHMDGLGFNFKWNMGWMHDILTFMSMDPYFRGANHNILTFSMMYAYSENFILPLSHDEVVHGKKSLIDKMFGTYEQKFKSLKLLYSYMYSHPGKKLMFMGGELGQFAEWSFKDSIDWHLLGYDTHKGIKNFVKDLNKFYTFDKALFENDEDWQGFEWLNEKDREKSIIALRRITKSGKDSTICLFNFSGTNISEYELPVKSAGEYKIVLDTEDKPYGGAGRETTILKAKSVKTGDYKYALTLDLPELCGVYIKKVKKIK